MATITTKHDKDIANQIQMIRHVTFYGVWRAMIKLATYQQRKALDLAIPRLFANQRASAHDVMISDKILATEGITFYAAMLAVIYLADTDNLLRLEHYFGAVVFEAKIRYYSPDACISIEEWKEHNPDLNVDEDLLTDLFDNARRQASLQ